MTNFQFLLPEFKPLFEPAAGAEQLVHSDPRAACMRTRHALEQAVHWLYANDQTLRMPYDNALGVLLTQPAFEKLLPPHVHKKAQLIQKTGNRAVHGSGRVGSGDALCLVRDLFHVLFWLARTYTRASDPKTLAATWEDARVPKQVRADEAAAFTREQLKKQEAAFRQQIEALHGELERREAAIAEQAVTLAERESLLARIDAELAAQRAELAKAKAANLAVPDTHDYDEADTRRRFIDELLREAGWVVGESAGVEVPVPGMPNAKGEGFADYVLWGADGKPLAVVEAKRSFTDPDVGRQQARLYADGLEKSTGRRPLIYYSNGHKTWLWDDLRAPPREVAGFHTRDALELAVFRRSEQLDPREVPIDAAIVGRSYQQRAIRAMAESFMQGRRAGLLTMATGTGKTRTAIALVDVLMRAHWAKRVLFLADRVALVKQAANAFKAHLPDASPVNLVTEKDGQGRVYLSTYPTMMGLIEEREGDRRIYDIGHFDVIVIDEAHRSVYQKYGAIFRYFDAYLIGLTATPREEVHRDTYRLFGLEKGVPTDAYTLDEAVANGYLVPPKAHSVPIKFVREGIRYDDLPDDEKEHWESLDWGDEAGEEPPEEVAPSAINKSLFNEHTVDLMLQHLMTHGLRVDCGEKIGKTIIFAVNQKHADFIARRFDANYQHHKGAFARVVTHSVKYAQSLIDDFSIASRLPQIAISVDMLDTGIDVPEVVNLVFFKTVRSKVKFLQMIGRGTRLCPDLFGPGQDKEMFYIFDFCGNFEFFNEHPAGAPATLTEPLGRRLFQRRLELLAMLPVPHVPWMSSGDETPAYDMLGGLRESLIEQLHAEVAAMNTGNFIVRQEHEHVVRYAERDAWKRLDEAALVELRERVAGLPTEQAPEHITAKLFDLTCLGLQIAMVRGSRDFIGYRDKVIEIAAQLEGMEAIPAIKQQLPLIQEVQTEAYWEGITLAIIESMRRDLRALVQFIERKAMAVVYTALTDEIGESTVAQLPDFNTGVNLAQYRKKVEAYIRASEHHVAIAKLRYNKPLTPTDLAELERFVYEADVVQGRERFEQAFGRDVSLPMFIRSLVGMDRNAANEAFGVFLDGSRYGSQQIRFIEMIIDRLTQSGYVEPGQLYEAPFTSVHYEGVDGAFSDADAGAIVTILERMRPGIAA